MNVARIQPTDLARYLQGAAGRRLIMVVNVLLVIWIAAQLASLTWALLPQQDDSGEAPAVAQSAQAVARPDPDRALIDQLPGWHLLGLPVREAAPVVAAVPQDAPDTQLRLTLRGALASDDKRNARAIIADQGGREEQYAIGASLPGNAELSDIYPDRVILKRNGRYETLRLPEENRVGGGASSAEPSFRPTTGDAASPAERLREIRAQLQKQPREIANMVQAARKVDESGNLLGYEISPGANPVLFENAGLQQGDIIVQVNDMDMKEPANGPRALNLLRNGESVSVRLLRDGVEQTLTLDGSAYPE